MSQPVARLTLNCFRAVFSSFFRSFFNFLSACVCWSVGRVVCSEATNGRMSQSLFGHGCCCCCCAKMWRKFVGWKQCGDDRMRCRHFYAEDDNNFISFDDTHTHTMASFAMLYYSYLKESMSHSPNAMQIKVNNYMQAKKQRKKIEPKHKMRLKMSSLRAMKHGFVVIVFVVAGINDGKWEEEGMITEELMWMIKGYVCVWTRARETSQQNYES